MQMGLKNIAFLSCLLFISACGNKINKTQVSRAENLSLLTIEKECRDDSGTMSPEAQEIAQVYSDLQSRFPMAFWNIPEKSYDYKAPLIINLDKISQELVVIKKNLELPGYLESHLSEIATTLHYMRQNSVRYEEQKCQFSLLARKKIHDLRPYLETIDFCQEKKTSECAPETQNEEKFIEERLVKMCQSITNNKVACQAQYNLERQNRKISPLLKHYQNRFQKERYEKLFVLAEGHSKFNCSLLEEKVTIMKMKVFIGTWNVEKITGLLSVVAQTWSRGNFKLEIEITPEKGSDVIEIIPSNGFISYVPNNNTNLVYLSQQLDERSQGRILAHEFGHVLGFPDCYTEFFDGERSDLVYYEQPATDTNMMCSLREGVSIPDAYLAQLAQRSCVFN